MARISKRAQSNGKAHHKTHDEDDLSAELREAKERADRAEAELAQLRAGAETSADSVSPEHLDATAPSSQGKAPFHSSSSGEEGEAALRNDSMMAHLMDSLDAGKDIGHYGRLVFAMVARHFLSSDEVVGWLTRDSDFSQEQATLMLRQVEGRDYNPPRRDRIVAWQAEQQFPILPHPEDPDCGNLYRTLKFPESIYHHIEEYQEQKVHAGSGAG
jgi:hypothetical protein